MFRQIEQDIYIQNKIVRVRWTSPQQDELRSDIHAKEVEEKEERKRERERVDERGKEPEIFHPFHKVYEAYPIWWHYNNGGNVWE